MDKPKNTISILPELFKYKGLIFDLDGTLIDLNIDWIHLKEKLKKFCLSQRNEVYEFTPLGQKIHDSKNRFGVRLYNKLMNIIYNFEKKEKNYRLNKRLINYINSNDTNDKKMAIYSMNTEKCVKKIINKHLTKFPDPIISLNTCREPKPTKKDLNAILKEWKLNKKDVAFVGNSDVDIKSGVAAGIKTFIIKL